MDKIPGITRQDEEERLRVVLDIADRKLQSKKQDVQMLEEQLHAMQEEFDESDKEQQAQWHNADARFREAGHELKRASQARKKPYFGRIDFVDHQIKKEECYYIGRSVIADDPAHPEVIDWRAPIASVYYDSALGETAYSVKGEGRFKILLNRKRTYEIDEDRLKDFYDSDVVANDELLTKYLAKNKRAVLSEIIATIQQEQNEVIRKKPQHNMIIQGAAGSGKTTVAMHRISYILYNYDVEFKPEDFYIIGSNKVLLNYITGVLPELNVYGVSQMTMEQLFVRLLYEAWDNKKYQVISVRRGVTEPVKGTLAWFRDLEEYARAYEFSLLPKGDVVLEKNHVRLMSEDMIESLFRRFDHLSRADKISMLSERLLGKLENEICGKYYSYSGEEKKALRRKYSTYFGKREWNGSIFELYDDFLKKQDEKGIHVSISPGFYDVYDLAALAYLYKRLQETEIIREAGHVVIDEAQDFGMMAYASLKYCLSTCTFTIMGDVSQNIYIDYGLNDWKELRELMLPNEFDYFGLLRKSYRNTVEISDYSTNILHHGSFEVYPVQPIIRHGKEVETVSCGSQKELLKKTVQYIEKWQAQGLETIAVICKDSETAKSIRTALENRLDLKDIEEDPSFEKGVLILPLELTKGLEFDAVLIYDASQENYPATDGQVKRLYVAATRALHELTVLYSGELTSLIAVPVTDEQLKLAVTEADKPTRKPMPVQEEKTNAEIALERAKRGEIELKERHYIGPRRIQLLEAQIIKKETEKQKEEAQLIQNDRKTVKATASKGSAKSKGTRLPSYYEQKLAEGPGKIANAKKETAQRMLTEFGAMPTQEELKPDGHSRIDSGIRFCIKGDKYVDLVSNYGTLRVDFPEVNAARIRFVKGTADVIKDDDFFHSEAMAGLQVREVRELIEISSKKIKLRIIKKTGEIAFMNEKDKVFLTEHASLPRQIGAGNSWVYFDFGRKEELAAKAPAGRMPLKIASSAKFISYGQECNEMPALRSSNGYEIWFPTGRKTLCCNIPMYGPYIRLEGNMVSYCVKCCQ